MIAVAFIIGIGLPALLGWLLLLLVEGENQLLSAGERICASLVLGPTLHALIVFLCYWVGLIRFTLPGFLLPLLVAIGLLGFLCYRRGLFNSAPALSPLKPAGTVTPKLKVAIGLLLVWTVMKLIAGGYDLVSTPTYWDDSFNNWNMRGKIFFLSHELTLAIPNGNGQQQTEGGVSSYPLAVPLTKTWLATLNGDWNDGLINSVHFVWFLSLVGLFYFSLRRFLGRWVSVLGVYALVSLPMLLVHGVNPYADVFLAAHLFLVVGSFLFAAHSDDEWAFLSWLKTGVVAWGLMLFTKNEATVLYSPILALLLLWLLYSRRQTGLLSRQHLGRAVGMIAGIFIVLAVPWLLFKWVNHLSFGNAKYLSDISIHFHADALQAMWYYFSREGNWLLLPILLPLTLLFAGRSAWRLPVGLLTVFIVLAFAMQMGTYLFTNLATEAIRQTGIGRGLVQIAPLVMLLVVLLWQQMLKESR